MPYDNDDDFAQGQDDPGHLREAVKKANKAAQAKDAENAELRKQLNALMLGNVFSEKKVPAALQRLMKAEGVEASSEAVDKWLNENGSDFGWSPQAASTQTPEGQVPAPEEAPAVQSVLTQEDIAAQTRIEGVALNNGGHHQGLDHISNTIAAAESAVGPDASFEALVKAIQSQGVETVSAYG